MRKSCHDSKTMFHSLLLISFPIICIHKKYKKKLQIISYKNYVPALTDSVTTFTIWLIVPLKKFKYFRFFCQNSW